MKLFEIFSTKKAFRFVESVDKLLNNVDTALIIFKDGVRCYLYNDMEGFAENLYYGEARGRGRRPAARD